MSTTQTKNKVIKTKSFKSRDKIVQKIITTRNNLLKIGRDLLICERVGYDQWEKQANSYWANKLIIKEITENEN